jgi:hypothetical protein
LSSASSDLALANQKRASDNRSFVLPSELPLAPDPTPAASQKVGSGAHLSAPGAASGAVGNVVGGGCTVSFNSIPASDVSLDGQTIGLTPRLGVSVAPGSHKVVFDRAEYDPVERSFACKPNEAKNVSVRFAKQLEPGEDIEMNPYR